MKVLDGSRLAETIKLELVEAVKKLQENNRKIPHLAAVLVGDDAASASYVKNKVKFCEDVGYESTLIRKDASISEHELMDIIQDLNENDDIDGFIVQLPLPNHIDEHKITLAINPAKDVDGFHPTNFGKMAQGLDAFLPATPYGILILLDRYGIETEGKHCVIVGRSSIVGSPMSILLSRKGEPGNCTVTLTHSRTKDITAETKRADILIAAIGIPGFITSDMVKEGAVVIDVGINRVEDESRKSGYRLVGDVDFDSLSDKVSAITPVPRGVGPMTVTALMLNTLKAANGKV